MPPHARAVSIGRGHRFAAYPRCSADLWRREHVEANPGADTALRLSGADGAAASPVPAWRSGAPCFSRRGAIAWS